MSAGRNANTLLLTLLGTIVLFAIFAVVINIATLQKHGYAATFGWQIEQKQVSGECDRVLVSTGFPLTTRRPASPDDDPSGCLDSTNAVARSMNYALCFAVAAIVAVGTVEGTKGLRA